MYAVSMDFILHVQSSMYVILHHIIRCVVISLFCYYYVYVLLLLFALPNGGVSSSGRAQHEVTQQIQSSNRDADQDEKRDVFYSQTVYYSFSGVKSDKYRNTCVLISFLFFFGKRRRENDGKWPIITGTSTMKVWLPWYIIIEI